MTIWDSCCKANSQALVEYWKNYNNSPIKRSLKTVSKQFSTFNVAYSRLTKVTNPSPFRHRYKRVSL